MATDSKGILDPDQGPRNLSIKDVFGGGGGVGSRGPIDSLEQKPPPPEDFQKWKQRKERKEKQKKCPYYCVFKLPTATRVL